jgi:hypothetical protein
MSAPAHRVNWLYFLGDKSNMNEVFLYGLSLPTSFSQLRNSKPKDICKLNGKQIYLFYSINEIDIAAITTSQNKIILNKINSCITTELDYFANRQVVQVSKQCYHKAPESPIGSKVEIGIYYSNDFYSYKNGRYVDDSNIDELHKILNALKEDTGQSFNGPYSKRMGSFEFGYAMKWAETPIPFKLRTDKQQPNKYYFSRTVSDEEMLVHLIVYSRSNEVLLDELKTIKQGIEEIQFTKELNGDGSFEYWVFSKDGDLLHRDKAHWLLGIGLTMNIAHGSTAIEDQDSRRDPKSKHVKPFTPKAAGEITHSKDKSYDLIRSREQIIYELANRYEIDKDETRGKWFSKSDNAISDITSYFNKLTSSQDSELLIIDPFISKESLSPLLRLENATIKIHVVSCWEALDPDNSSPAPKDNTKKGIVKTMNDLKGYGLPISNLTWHDMKASKFHDRLIVVSHGDEKKVFMLSNSINNFLKKYNFCIISIDGLIKAKCLAYIYALMTKCSDKSRIYPEVRDAS